MNTRGTSKTISISGDNFSINISNLSLEEARLIEEWKNGSGLCWRDLLIRTARRDRAGQEQFADRFVEAQIDVIGETVNEDTAELLNGLKSFILSQPQEGAKERLISMMPYIIRGTKED